MVERNWAGSHTYRGRVVGPRSVDELQTLVATHDRVKALGTRHSFTDIADTDGVLVSLEDLPPTLRIDESGPSVTVSGATTFHTLSEELHRQGWGLATMASLPHISVAGAIATGTHGSGRRVQGLAALVNGLDLVQADGELRRVERGNPDFEGSVVSLGALGVVTHVSLDLVPTYDLWQEVWLELPWESLLAPDAVARLRLQREPVHLLDRRQRRPGVGQGQVRARSTETSGPPAGRGRRST